jgi:hypothetical protein
MDYRRNLDSNTGDADWCCRPLCDTTIESIEKYEQDCWVVVDEWVNARVGYAGGFIIGGEGGFGGDGFIAHIDARGGLRWGFFFEQTNPIAGVELEGNMLRAINEHSEIAVEIDLSQLAGVKISTIN